MRLGYWFALLALAFCGVVMVAGAIHDGSKAAKVYEAQLTARVASDGSLSLSDTEFEPRSGQTLHLRVRVVAGDEAAPEAQMAGKTVSVVRVTDSNHAGLRLASATIRRMAPGYGADLDINLSAGRYGLTTEGAPAVAVFTVETQG